MTPIVAPARSAGVRTTPPSAAITAASGRWTIAPTPTRSSACLAGDREVVDVDDRKVGPAGLEQPWRVGRGARLADLELDSPVGEQPTPLRDVDPGVNRVRDEVEDQGQGTDRAARRQRARPVQRRSRRPRRGGEQDGRQRRGDPSHSRRRLDG